MIRKTCDRSNQIVIVEGMRARVKGVVVAVVYSWSRIWTEPNGMNHFLLLNLHSIAIYAHILKTVGLVDAVGWLWPLNWNDNRWLRAML